jgi:hypothetical protein
MTPASPVAVLFALGSFAVCLIAFMVIVKTLGAVGISLLRLEYLLSRELALVTEREQIKKEIMDKQARDEESRKRRDEEMDPLLKMPFSIKKGRTDGK